MSATILTMLLVSVSPARAQVFSESSGTASGDHVPPPGSYSRGAYMVTAGGTFIYGGDVAVGCKSLPAPVANEAGELCKAAGFPPKDVSRTINSTDDLTADEEGKLIGSSPPKFEVTEDGSLIIGGDIFAADYCRSLDEDPKETIAKEAFRACARAGFSPIGVEDVSLAETGGPRFIVVGLSILALLCSTFIRRLL